MITDARRAARGLQRSPGFAACAILALALGIGANSAVFAVLHAVVLRPLPYRAPDRLVRIWETNPAQGLERSDVSPGTFADWRARTRTLDAIAVYLPREWFLAFGSGMDVVPGAIVSPSLFPLLGVTPLIGRTLTLESPDAPRAQDDREAVIGYALWQRRFGGRSDIIGQTVRVEDRIALTVVGVMPAGFDFPAGTEIWRAVRFARTIGARERLMRFYEAVGRLRPGASIEDARAELAAISTQLEGEHPQSNAGFGATLERLDATLVRNVRSSLLVLSGAAGCLFLIGCANVAGLLIARGAVRRHELGIRAALGAGRARLFREVAAESILLAVAGAALGVTASFWCTRVLVSLAPAGIPRLQDAGVEASVLVFAGALTAIATLAVALVPYAQIRPGDVHELLKAGGKGTEPPRSAALRTTVLAAQVALTATLLVCAALLFRSFIALNRVDLGFETRHVMTADLRLGTGAYAHLPRPWFALGKYYDDLLDELGTLPGVVSAGGVTGMPLTGDGSAGKFWMDDGTFVRPNADRQFDAAIDIVTPGYFAALGIPLRRGRLFEEADRLSEDALTNPRDRRERPAGTALINEAMARRYWPGQDPIGRSIVLLDHWAVSSTTIVGVVGDVRAQGVALAAEPAIYVPWGEIPGFRMSVALRTVAGGDARALRERLRARDPRLVVTKVGTLGEIVDSAVAGPRFNLLLTSSFALLAVALAGVGIYGLVSYLVARRTREIGIRMAIGARPSDVLRLVLQDGLWPVALGAAAGLLTSLIAARAMGTILFGIGALDAPSFAVGIGALLLVAIVAIIAPALRAVSVDPLAALRDE